MSTETWRSIPGWEGFYEVSDAGRVKSLARTVPGRPGVRLTVRERLIHGTPNSDGYIHIALTRGNVRTIRGLHRIVLTAFIGEAPEGTEACHGDGVKTNNHLDNLRWDTRSANTYDRIKHGTHYAARKTHCDHGHPFDAANTYLYLGRRHCRACRLAAKRRQNARISQRTAA